jgi:hypothetical protein
VSDDYKMPSAGKDVPNETVASGPLTAIAALQNRIWEVEKIAALERSSGNETLAHSWDCRCAGLKEALAFYHAVVDQP